MPPKQQDQSACSAKILSSILSNHPDISTNSLKTETRSLCDANALNNVFLKQLFGNLLFLPNRNEILRISIGGRILKIRGVHTTHIPNYHHLNTISIKVHIIYSLNCARVPILSHTNYNVLERRSQLHVIDHLLNTLHVHRTEAEIMTSSR